MGKLIAQYLVSLILRRDRYLSDNPSHYAAAHTWPSTEMVMHPSTNQAQCFLTSVIRQQLLKLHHLAR